MAKRHSQEEAFLNPVLQAEDAAERAHPNPWKEMGTALPAVPAAEICVQYMWLRVESELSRTRVEGFLLFLTSPKLLRISRFL